MTICSILKPPGIILLACFGAAMATTAQAAININDVTVTEGETAVVTVSLDAPVQRGNVRVDYATQDDTAVDGEDYIGTSGTLRFRRGEQEKQISIETIDDTVTEQTENFNVVLSNARGDNIAGDGTGVVTILDNDQVNQVCDIAVDPTSLAFGDVEVGQSASGSTTASVFCARTWFS